MGVFHGSELPFVFEVDVTLLSKEERALSVVFGQYWTNLATHANPNGASGGQSDLPLWPLYDVTEDAVLRLDITPTVIKQNRKAMCDVWDTVEPFNPP
jgi:carboxylesterase type B